MYLRARYYSSSAGRFISRDTWSGDSYRPMSYNSWLYASANPVNLRDPSGHDPWWCDGRPDELQCYEAYQQQKGLSPSSFGVTFNGFPQNTCDQLRGLGVGTWPRTVTFLSPRELMPGSGYFYQFRTFAITNHTQYVIIDPLRTGSSKNVWKLDEPGYGADFWHTSTNGPIFGKTREVAGLESLGRLGKAIKIAGIGALLVVAAYDVYNLDQIYQAGRATGDYREFQSEFAGTAGSWAGAWAGAELGLSVGASVGSIVPGPGTVVGAVVGGIGGGLAGAGVGDWLGRQALFWVNGWKP